MTNSPTDGDRSSEATLLENEDKKPAYLAGRPHAPNFDLAVTDKFTGRTVARVPRCTKADFDEAARLATEAFEAKKEIPPYQRSEILAHISRRITEERDRLAHLLCAEVGKPLRDAASEVSRAAETFRVASEEALRIGGEVLELERHPRIAGYLGLWKRFPTGPVGAITPFNFPLNLVAHKVAPALAAGCPFVLKPASYTPLSALAIAEFLSETDLEPKYFSVLPASGETAETMAYDPRLRVLTFTGSAEVGWQLLAKAKMKRVLLELGGNAGCIVDDTADIAWACERIVFGGFYQAGQSCISVQRVLVSRSIYEEFTEALVERVLALEVGDPRKESTFVGPLISEADAIRVETWISDAIAAGARLLCGGKRDGAIVAPAVVADVPHDRPLYCKEVFGPVVTLESFDSFEEALRIVNDSEYGLQAGVFTNDLGRALLAFQTLDVGGVVIGDVPSFRADHMPYGGTKSSGMGREGVRFAIEEFTEPKMLVIKK
jgi:acyl-CoA reductase-like NAD-dependent aldehyde dehydrogenase